MLLCSAVVLALSAAPASASPRSPGGVIKLPRTPHLRGATTESNNWFGYDQGALEEGKLFNAISGEWTVPVATQHSAGQEEASATWIGIGGGCVNEGCAASDPTSLIQTGTEQNVEPSGAASYSAWWELVPVPAITIEGMHVSPGDRMRAEIAEAIPDAEVWNITLRDVTTGQSFSQEVPYPSSHASAEWIEETPLSFGTSGAGLTALPNLTETSFENATVNGSAAKLTPSQKIALTSESRVIGTPSEPNSAASGFGACAWATTCPMP